MGFMSTATLQTIRKKVLDGRRLSADEGLFLSGPDVSLGEVGELANLTRERTNGDHAYYNINTHLNPTNVCVYQCTFCAFRAGLNDPRAYIMDAEQVLDRGREADRAGCTEIHIVGGIHGEKTYDWYLDIVRSLHRAFPRLHLKAWTAVEIDWFARSTGRPVAEILEELIEAGMGSMPGGGAEIFDPHVRAQICQHKSNADRWLDVHRTAHRLGLRTNATMLYGHVEAAEHRIGHLMRLRELQDETGGFQTFIPLAFHPENTGLSHLEKATAATDLRTIAVGRLMLDNFEHVKAYWVMLGLGTAQTALAFGADDLDGTVRHESIGHDAGAESPEALSITQIRHLIEEAGRAPVERDTLYRHVHRNGDDPSQWTIGESIRKTG